MASGCCRFAFRCTSSSAGRSPQGCKDRHCLVMFNSVLLPFVALFNLYWLVVPSLKLFFAASVQLCGFLLKLFALLGVLCVQFCLAKLSWKFHVQIKPYWIIFTEILHSVPLLSHSTLFPHLLQGCKNSAKHSYPYQCVRYFCVSWHGCQHLGFSACANMLMHVFTHWGGTNTVTDSALKVSSGRIIITAAGEWNPCQYCTWILGSVLHQWAIPSTQWRHSVTARFRESSEH